MKNVIRLLAVFAFFLTGCSSDELTREEALSLLQKEKGYPRIVGYDIYCGDPKHARQVLDAGLESGGLVIVHKTAKLKDIGKKPIIEFTAKAQPYLLPTPEEDRETKIQRVKIAGEKIKEITAIIPNEQRNSVTIEYVTAYENPTPFAPLYRWDLKEPKERTAYFIQSDAGWVQDKMAH